MCVHVCIKSVVWESVRACGPLFPVYPTLIHQVCNIPSLVQFALLIFRHKNAHERKIISVAPLIYLCPLLCSVLVGFGYMQKHKNARKLEQEGATWSSTILLFIVIMVYHKPHLHQIPICLLF